MKTVIVAYQKPMAKSSTPITGDDAVVRANVFLNISDSIVDLFNIPVPTGSFSTSDSVKVKGSTYKREYTDANEKVITKDVTVPEYERTAGGISHAFNVVRLRNPNKPLTKTGQTTPYGYRTVSIRNRLAWTKGLHPVVFSYESEHRILFKSIRACLAKSR
jgi:hypothetical protein